MLFRERGALGAFVLHMPKVHNISFVINKLANKLANKPTDNFITPIFQPCMLTLIESVVQNHFSIQRAFLPFNGVYLLFALLIMAIRIEPNAWI